MYWPRPSVCVSVCLFLTAFPHYCMDLDVAWGNGKGCPVVVQSVHGFHCYDNIHVCKLTALSTANAYSAEHELSMSACTHSMAGCYHGRPYIVTGRPLCFTAVVSFSYGRHCGFFLLHFPRLF